MTNLKNPGRSALQDEGFRMNAVVSQQVAKSQQTIEACDVAAGTMNR
jgi:hypothetical protein